MSNVMGAISRCQEGFSSKRYVRKKFFRWKYQISSCTYLLANRQSWQMACMLRFKLVVVFNY